MARGAGHRSLLHGSFLARSADRTLSSLTSCSLDARLRCPVGLRAGGGTVGRFFPLAAFEYLLAAANSLAPRRSGILPALLGRRPCRRRVSYADVHVRALAIANCRSTFSRRAQTVKVLQAVLAPLESSLSVPPRSRINRFGHAFCAAVQLEHLLQEVPPAWIPVWFRLRRYAGGEAKVTIDVVGNRDLPRVQLHSQDCLARTRTSFQVRRR